MRHDQAGRSGWLTHFGRIDSRLSTLPDVAHAGHAQAGRPGVAIPAPGRPETFERAPRWRRPLPACGETSLGCRAPTRLAPLHYGDLSAIGGCSPGADALGAALGHPGSAVAGRSRMAGALPVATDVRMVVAGAQAAAPACPWGRFSVPASRRSVRLGRPPAL